MASLDRRDAATKAHNLLASKGYTRNASDPTLFTSGTSAVRVPADGELGLAKKIKVTGGSEQLLMTFRLLDDTQSDLTANT